MFHVQVALPNPKDTLERPPLSIIPPASEKKVGWIGVFASILLFLATKRPHKGRKEREEGKRKDERHFFLLGTWISFRTV